MATAGITGSVKGATSPRGMSISEVLELPATVNVVDAARVLGIGHNKAYELIRNGTFPVRPLVLGSTVRIPTAALWEVLGVGSLRPVGEPQE
jgi:predicted DNA-binding transcriptional regulator AlpA